MPNPVRRPPPPATRLSRRSVRPAGSLVLAAVLGAHLWVLDAWSLTTDLPDPRADRTLTAARVTTLPVPAPTPAHSAAEPTHLPRAPLPVTAAPTVPAPLPAPRPRLQRLSTSAAPLAAPSPAALAPSPAAAEVVPNAPPDTALTAVAPETSPAADPIDAVDTVAAPLHLALATPAANPVRGAATAPAGALSAPPSARLHYRMHKGALSGTGRIDWQRDAGTYRMRLEARVPVFGQIFLETSDGRLDASGLLPLRHTERRLKRSERALSFVRDQGPPRILFSAREGQEPLTPGAQDRLSWIAQLATRMASPPSGDWRVGQQLAMDVASTGGDVQRWVFTLLGQDAAGLWQLRREPDSPHDTRAEVWIDARQHHWPVRIRLSEPGGDPLELTLEGLQPT